MKKREYQNYSDEALEREIASIQEELGCREELRKMRQEKQKQKDIETIFKLLEKYDDLEELFSFTIRYEMDNEEVRVDGLYQNKIAIDIDVT